MRGKHKSGLKLSAAHQLPNLSCLEMLPLLVPEFAAVINHGLQETFPWSQREIRASKNFGDE